MRPRREPDRAVDLAVVLSAVAAGCAFVLAGKVLELGLLAIGF